MNAIREALATAGTLTPEARALVLQRCGTRGKKALAAIDSGGVRKFLDFFVVSGTRGEYVVDGDFCTCEAALIRNRPCWHVLAVEIATLTGSFTDVPAWYQDQWDH